jgi:DNA-binding MarR family transcriptional regulator
LQQTARRTTVSVTPEGRALVGEGKATNDSLQALYCSYGDGSDEDVS